MTAWLVDTGPLIAYLNAGDPGHDEVAACWDRFTGTLVTSSAVVTEAMHFVSADPGGPGKLAELVAASSMEVLDLSQAPELRAAAALMRQYSDTPMDYADATLLLIAEALGIGHVLTLDRRGFSVYRTRKKRALTNVLDNPPTRG